MAPSDNTAVPELIEALTHRDSDVQRRAASELSRQIYTSNDLDRVSAEHLNELRDVLNSTEDDIVRRHTAAFCCCALQLRGPAEGGLNYRRDAKMIDRLLQLAHDDDWRIRQTVLTPDFTDQLSITVARRNEDPDTRPRESASSPTSLHRTYAETLISRLDDPVAGVRRRVGEALIGMGSVMGPFDHDAELVLGHPDSAIAARKLIDVLSDPIDNIGGTGRGRSPRQAAGTVLTALSIHQSKWVRPHIGRLVETLNDEDPAVQLVALETLAPMIAKDPGLDSTALAEFSRTCTEIITNEATTGHQRKRVLSVINVPVEANPEFAMQAAISIASALDDTNENVRTKAADVGTQLTQLVPDTVSMSVQRMVSSVGSNDYNRE